MDGAWGVQARGTPWTGDFLGQLCCAVQLLGAGAGRPSSGWRGAQWGGGLGSWGTQGQMQFRETFCVLGTHHMADAVTDPGKATGSFPGSPWGWGVEAGEGRKEALRLGAPEPTILPPDVVSLDSKTHPSI